MPNFVSVNGKFIPQKERVYLPDEDRIYEGPDRAALEMLEQNGGSLGHDIRTDPDLLMRIRQLGFKDLDEYLSFYGISRDEKAKEQMKKTEVVNRHESPRKIKAAKIDRSGGQDTSGNGKHIEGGFGDAPGVPNLKKQG